MQPALRNSIPTPNSSYPPAYLLLPDNDTVLTSIEEILLCPLSVREFGHDIHGSILSRSVLFGQRKLLAIDLAPNGSAKETRAFTAWMMGFQFVFRKTLGGELGWKTSAGRLAFMRTRLARVEKGDMVGLRNEAQAALARQRELENAREATADAAGARTESQRRLRRALRLGFLAKYGK